MICRNADVTEFETSDCSLYFKRKLQVIQINNLLDQLYCASSGSNVLIISIQL